MTKSEYFKFAHTFFDNCIRISEKKNADYTGLSDDPFSNFTFVENMGVKTEQGFITRMGDKLKRIASFTERGELSVQNESVMDSLSDLANYCCLMAGYIKSIEDRVETKLPWEE